MGMSMDGDKRVDEPSRAFQRSVSGVVGTVRVLCCACYVLCPVCCKLCCVLCGVCFELRVVRCVVCLVCYVVCLTVCIVF